MRFFRAALFAASVAAAGLPATPAAAQRSVGGGFSVSGGGTIATDYRFRGISQTGEDPAAQATVTVDHESGFYGGVWASTLGDDDERSADFEIDLYAGYTRQIANGTDVDVGLTYYAFPDGNGRLGAGDYFEPYASVSHTLGPATLEVGAAYAPEQDALDGADNIYVYTDLRAGVPFTPVSVAGHFGYSDGALAPGGDYLDWSLGLEVARGPATIALTYVDTDIPNLPIADSALVLSVRLGF